VKFVGGVECVTKQQLIGFWLWSGSRCGSGRRYRNFKMEFVQLRQFYDCYW